MRLINIIIATLVVQVALFSQKSFSTVVDYDRSEERGVQLIPFEDGYLICTNNSGCDIARRSIRLDIINGEGVHVYGRQVESCPFDQYAADLIPMVMLDSLVYVYITKDDSFSPDYDLNTHVLVFNLGLELIDSFPISRTPLLDLSRSILRSNENLYLLEGRGHRGRGDSIRLIKANNEGVVLGNYEVVPRLGEGNTPTIGLWEIHKVRLFISSRYFNLNGPLFAPHILIVDTLGGIISEWGHEELDLEMEGLRCNTSIQRPLMDNAFAMSWCRDSFLGSGYYTREHVAIHKHDYNGSRIWESMVPMRYESEVFGITALRDSSILCVGNGQHEEGLRGGWVFKLSSEGEVLWNKVFTHLNDPYNSFFEGAVELENGSIALIGTINNINSSDTWVMVLDSSGCLQDRCDSVLITSQETFEYENLSDNFHVFPNPSTNGPTIQVPSRLQGLINLNDCQLKVYSMDGKVIHVDKSLLSKSDRMDLSVLNLRSGVYFALISYGSRIWKSEPIIVIN